MLLRGLGLTADEPKAVGYLRNAAEKGIAGAQNRLAHVYLEGIGVDRSKVEAAKWRLLAKPSGLEDAALERPWLASRPTARARRSAAWRERAELQLRTAVRSGRLPRGRYVSETTKARGPARPAEIAAGAGACRGQTRAARAHACSALMNVMVAAARKAGRSLARDFGVVEQLQVSVKGPRTSSPRPPPREEIFPRAAKARLATAFMRSGARSRARPHAPLIVDPLDGTTNFLHSIPPCHLNRTRARASWPAPSSIIRSATNSTSDDKVPS
jgi:hypothetical protein